jgi:hypothetical protein
VGWRLSLVAVAGLLAIPSPVQAASRFAEPLGNGPEPCLQGDPCNIQVAVESGAVMNGDEIVVLPGEYQLGGDVLVVNDVIDLHGQSGQSRPRLFSTAIPAVQSAVGSTSTTVVRDLEIHKTTSGTAIQIFQAPMTVERAIVTSAGFAACNPARTGALIRDSVCWNTGQGSAVNFNTSGNVTNTAQLRNVTAVTTGSAGLRFGLLLDASGGADLILDARNVIAVGATVDVRAETNSDPSTSATLTLANSNYDAADTVGAATSVTPVGSPTNQVAAPFLANPSMGDFHQLSGSPTIDAGAANPLLGLSDLDGDPRTLGAGPDIGADEFIPLDSDPPETTITKGPRRETRKRRAKLRFLADEPGSTFLCKRDKQGFAPCTSPVRYKKLSRRNHKFKVRAIDPAGNADPTPAKRKWTVNEATG